MIRPGLLCCCVLFALSTSAQAGTPDTGTTTAFDRALTTARGSMVSAPADALQAAKAAETLAAAIREPKESALEGATAQWLEAEAMIRLKTPRPALDLLQATYARVTQLAPGTKLEADVLKSRGRAFVALGNVQSALVDFQAACRIYQHLYERRGEAMALQEIGTLYTAARDYKHVTEYFTQSSEVLPHDPTLALVAYNNLGFALKETGKFAEAEAQFRRALASATQIGSPSLEASILSNIAYVQTRDNDPGAEATVRKGLALAEHDASAASERPYLFGVLAQLRYQQGRYAEARDLIRKTFEGVDISRSSPDYRDFHAIASRIYEKMGDFHQAFLQQSAVKRLDDASVVLASSTNAALMTAQFDFANQDLRISKLKTGELERDILLARSKAKLHAFTVWALLLGGGGVLAATLVGFVGMRRSRNAVRVVNAHLTRALQAKTEFLATTSHEIRTPLNGILGMTQVLLAGRELAPTVRERLELMLGAGHTMRTLVDDLLDAAKAERGEIELDPRPVFLPQLVREVAELWRGQAETRGIVLTATTEGAEVVVADGGRLRQILLNLTSNAVKFTETGTVQLHLRAEDDGLVVQVQDTGIGIPGGHLERIFEPFSQVDAGITRKYGGTGLGLPICRKICEAMEGTLTVRSELGVGSTFTARLPTVRPEAPAPAESSAPRDDLSKVRLLIIERNVLTQRILTACLAPRVGSVTCVGDPTAAIAHAAAAEPDVVLIDGAALEGGEADLATVRALGDRRGKPLLIVTCPPQEFGAFELLRPAVSCELIAKPIAPAALVQAVADAWESRMGREAPRSAA